MYRHTGFCSTLWTCFFFTSMLGLILWRPPSICIAKEVKRPCACFVTLERRLSQKPLPHWTFSQRCAHLDLMSVVHMFFCVLLAQMHVVYVQRCGDSMWRPLNTLYTGVCRCPPCIVWWGRHMCVCVCLPPSCTHLGYIFFFSSPCGGGAATILYCKAGAMLSMLLLYSFCFLVHVYEWYFV